jgi:hypothetical protein
MIPSRLVFPLKRYCFSSRVRIQVIRVRQSRQQRRNKGHCRINLKIGEPQFAPFHTSEMRFFTHIPIFPNLGTVKVHLLPQALIPHSPYGWLILGFSLDMCVVSFMINLYITISRIPSRILKTISILAVKTAQITKFFIRNISQKGILSELCQKKGKNLDYLLMVIGMRSLLNSRIAISTGSNIVTGTSIMTGAPMETCNALAPIILAFSNLVKDM